jgi:hypothetical protein
VIQEKDPQAVVRLVIDDGERREVPFGAGVREEVRQELEAIISELPPPGPTRARDLATPGSGCFGCSVRHMCPAYRDVAPTWWSSYPADVERVPMDTWGEVLERRDSRSAGALDVILRDTVGRRVRVDGIAGRHAIGGASNVAMFQLEATGHTRGFDGRRYHPRCFHELPRDPRERRAWAATCFEIVPPERVSR